MALTLNGTTKWPNAKDLKKLGETRISSSPSKVKRILARIEHAMSEMMDEIRVYIKEHPDFKHTGERMIQEWEEGMVLSLRIAS